MTRSRSTPQSSQMIWMEERISKLEHDLAAATKAVAEREAEIATLRVLHSRTLKCLESVGLYGPLHADIDEALSTPPSTSYLEQWEKDRFVQVAHAVGVGDWTYTVSHTLHVGTPLYARKEK